MAMRGKNPRKAEGGSRQRDHPRPTMRAGNHNAMCEMRSPARFAATNMRRE